MSQQAIVTEGGNRAFTSLMLKISICADDKFSLFVSVFALTQNYSSFCDGCFEAMAMSGKNAQFAATCRKRAAELRHQAEECGSPGLRDSLLKLAGDWDKLAQDAENADDTRSR